MASVTVDLQLDVVTCYKCAVSFGLPTRLVRELRRNHETFYCPSGHPQHFAAKSPEEKLKADLERAREEAKWWMKREERASERAERIERSRAAYKGHLTRTKNRIAAGTCPCCESRFEDLAEHMASEHPEYVSEEA